MVIVGNKPFSSKRVLSSLAKQSYGTDRLKRIVRGLSGAHDDAALDTDATASRSEQTITQSPVEEKKPAHAQFSKNGFTPVATRNVTRSAVIPPERMIAAFVSAIFCSLDGKSFELNQKVKEEALCLSKTSLEWGTFRTTYQGPAKKVWAPWGYYYYPKFYLVDHLGMGSTSKAYLALTPDGYDCVVKIYVKRRGDDKVVLSKKVFDKEANKAVAREVNMYKTIYGDELSGYVWQQKMNGLQCVIHPYFKHPDKEDRIDLLDKIRTRLIDSFANRGKAFATSDQVWRHVGWFNKKLYLFDLADLEPGGAGDVDNHINRLRLRHTGTQAPDDTDASG
jgi:hypothetical protein